MLDLRLRYACVLLLALLASCEDHETSCEVTADCAAGERCTAEGVCRPSECEYTDLVVRAPVAPTEELDLILVMDDSGGTVEEHRMVADALPRLVQSLTTGTHPTTGARFAAVESLRLGVISGDMGSGPSGACASEFGDDGVLLTQGDTSRPECIATYPTWLEFASTVDDLDTYVSDARCLLTALGTGGCGFEQPLEAALEALTPSSSELTFAGGHAGHGDGQNAGFLRQRSMLAIIVVADEDDCSAADLRLYDLEDPTYGPDANARCTAFPEALRPVERYVDGLLALRADAPERLLYAAIGGVPLDLVPDPEAPLAAQLDVALTDPRMTPQVDDTGNLVPSCGGSGSGTMYTFPPRRLVQVARGLNARGALVTVGSLCQEALNGTVDDILTVLADQLAARCLARPLVRDSPGTVPCQLFELIDPSLGPEACMGAPGRTLDGVTGEGDLRCVITQLPAAGTPPPEDADGWYYDDFSADAAGRCPMGATIRYNGSASPRSERRRRLSCETESVREVGLGTSCSEDPSICADVGLGCQPTTLICAHACVTAADCPTDHVCRDGWCANPLCH